MVFDIKSFLQVATSTGKVSKVVYHKKTMKQESVTKALLFREFKHFTSSPGYMLNSGLGIFLMPICAVALLWKGRKIFIMLNGMFGSQDGMCTVVGYDYAVWSYINGYHDSTFDFFGGKKSVDCTVSSCDTMAGSSCKTGYAAYFK